jgi:N-acetylglucosamine-6-phosphate deacetylase
VAVKAKQKGGAILVTDAMATVGSDTDTFELNGEIIKAIDGKCENSAGSLAGSALNMNQAVKNAIQYANITPEEAFRMASLYPAQAIHMGDTLGKIAAGYKANFVALDKNFDVTGTWIEGNKV